MQNTFPRQLFVDILLIWAEDERGEGELNMTNPLSLVLWKI